MRRAGGRTRVEHHLQTQTVLAAVLLAATACGSPPESLQRQPNILLVVVDALRSDHVGAYGYALPTTPSVDALATESFLFQNAFSNSTWTKPSVATLLTSLYPAQHGLGRVGFESAEGFRTDRLNDRHRTLAELLHGAGYATCAVGANVHVQQKTGFAQGFDHFVSRRLMTAQEINHLFYAWLRETDNSPFFAYLHYMDAHWPYDRRLAGAEARFGSTRIKPNPPKSWRRVARWAKWHLDEHNLNGLRARYDQEVAFADRAFGELIQTLRSQGSYEDTIVILTADHGEGFYEHEELQHGFEPFDEVIRVPLLIRLPAWRGDRHLALEETVGLVDLMPTLLELAGIDASDEIEGRSLVPLFEGRPLSERPVYIEAAEIFGVRSRNHKLLMTREGDAICYELTSDPGEQSPLLDYPPPGCRRLARQLAQLRHRLEEDPRTTEVSETVGLDADEVEALRSLGYLDK